MVSCILLCFGALALVPWMLGVYVLVLTVRVRRLRASVEQPFGPSGTPLGGFWGADSGREAMNRRREALVVSYPRWATILGVVLALQLMGVGAALAADVAVSLWIWWVA